MSAQQTVNAKKSEYLFSSPAVFTPLLQRNARGWMTLFLLLTDLTGLLLTMSLAFLFQRYVLLSSPNAEMLREMLFLPLAFVAITSTTGLYPAFGLNPVEELRRQTIATSLVFLSLIGLTFLTKSSMVYSRFLFLSCWTMSLAALPLGRALLRALLPHFSAWGEPIALVGPQAKALELANYLKQNRWIGLRPMAIFDDCTRKMEREGMPVLSKMNLRAYCMNKKIDSAIVINTNADLLFSSRESYDDLFKRVVFVPQTYEHQWLTGLTVMEYGEMVGFEIKHNLLDAWSQTYKRIIDILISSLGLIFLSPVLLAIAAVLWLDSPGRIFYRQTRLSKSDRKFTMVKFRTMQINADHVLHTFLAAHPEQQIEWEKYQKLKEDPRITRFGRFMRRFSLDELPQLWNVLCGEMSLVGPRPILPDQHNRYGKSYSFYRRVNPGITGLWQISGRNQTSFERRVELDNNYVSNWSIWLDILILVKTIWVVIRQKGAY